MKNPDGSVWVFRTNTTKILGSIVIYLQILQDLHPF